MRTMIVMAAAGLILAACQHTTTGPTVTSSSLPPMGVLSDSYGDSISGVVRALDGDTLSIHGIKVDLIAVDAPTLNEQCVSPGVGRKVIPCGEWAHDALKKAIQVGRVRCRMVATKRRNPDRPLAFCAVELRGDRERLEGMVLTSDNPALQETFDILEAELTEVRGFRSVDPVRGTINIDLGRMMIQSGLAEYVPETIAHLAIEIRDAADYVSSVPGYEMSDQDRAIMERWGPKRR